MERNMRDQELRKQLTIMVYSFIFKRILPTMDGKYKIGNIEYSEKLNHLIRKHSKEGYKKTIFESFDLIESHSQINPVKDSNFNNWINGTSNPKNYAIINAVIEYVYETCESEEKLIHLKMELLGVVSSLALLDYSDHLIDGIIENWKSTLKNDVSIDDVSRIFKEVLYLLKDKNRHISYLLHQRHELAATSETIYLESSENSENSGIEDVFSVSSVPILPAPMKVKTQQKPRLIFGFLGMLMISFILIFGNQLLFDQPAKSSEVAIVEEDTTPLEQSETVPSEPETNMSSPAQTMKIDEINNIPTEVELTPTIILFPTPDITVKYEPLQLAWEPVEAASSYDVAIKDTISDDIIFESKGVLDTSLTIDSKFLLHGAQYKLFIISRKDFSSSNAAVLPFSVEKLESPVITSPKTLSAYKLSDIVVNWKEITGADTYKIVVTDKVRWVKVFEKNYISETTTTIDKSVLFPGIEYRIYIASQNSSIESVPNYIDIRIDKLDSPLIISPTNNSTLGKEDFELQWSPVDLAASYMLEILETNTWEKVFSQDGIKETRLSIDHSLFQIGGSYRFYLFAKIGTASSDPVYLDLKAPELTPPKLIAPINSAVLPLTSIEVTWHASPFADTYKLVVTDTITWETVLSLEHIEGQTATIDKSLLNINGTYRIYIMSNSGSLTSVPNYIDIRVESLPIPKILSPKRNTQFSDQDIRIEWGPSPYITTYKITVTDLSSWTAVYSNNSLMAEDIVIDKNLLQKGGSYRIYIQSVSGTLESEPAYIDFSLQP